MTAYFYFNPYYEKVEKGNHQEVISDYCRKIDINPQHVLVFSTNLSIANQDIGDIEYGFIDTKKVVYLVDNNQNRTNINC